MRIAIDTGGTFTDCLFVSGGKLHIIKVASQPQKPSEAIAEALRQVFNLTTCAADAPTSAASDAAIDLVCGTTVGTNAILEHRGGRVALVTTAGFEDVLEIGRQARPKLYDFFVEKPPPLVPPDRRIGTMERLAADGAVVSALTEREVARVVRAVKRTRPDAVAVCFLFSFRNANHEKRIAKALRAAGYLTSVSHEILPEFREYERTATTVINAYLAPVMSGYLRAAQLRATEIAEQQITAFSPAASRSKPKQIYQQKPSPHQVRILQSNGGIISAEQAAREPVRTILSGPAGGLIGAQYAAQLAGLGKIITFDMGGTSTDVALLSGSLRTTSESTVAGMPVAVPMLEIHTVGAGGGSIARFDRGGSLRVGPESAGAAPGPICYGLGEQPTVTDAHAVLGHLGEQGLLGGSFQLDIPRARKRMEKLRGSFRSVEAFAEGILAVANAVMEKAIRVISIQRGHDPREYSLLAFGGAGGLHACDLAAALEMPSVLLPVFPGGLSALGILRADVVKDFSRTALLSVENSRHTAASLSTFWRPLEADAARTLRKEGFPPARIRLERSLDMRYVGQAYELSVPATGDFVAAFHRAHEQSYGYHHPQCSVEIVNLRCRVTGVTPKPEITRIARAAPGEHVPVNTVLPCSFRGTLKRTRFFSREHLRAGHLIEGPAVITEYSATALLPPGWNAYVDAYGQILLRPRKIARVHAPRS